MNILYGFLVAVRVFEGNTQAPKTVGEQVRTLASSFGVKEVTMAGDRRMLKQMVLFDERLCILQWDNVCYILRYNPEKTKEIEHEVVKIFLIA